MLIRLSYEIEHERFKKIFVDAEGDFVVCDSDQELQTALDFLATAGSQSDLLRLYVRLTGPTKPQSSATFVRPEDVVTVEDDMDTDQEPGSKNKKPDEKKEEPVGPKEHTGVSCDGCGGLVIGSRFKV
jgi:hypothetical protein